MAVGVGLFVMPACSLFSAAVFGWRVKYARILGAPRVATGTGERLILGYQKSALPDTDCHAMWYEREGLSKPFHGCKKPIPLNAFRADVPPAPAQWLPLAADDFWYSSMRRPPKAAAARVDTR